MKKVSLSMEQEFELIKMKAEIESCNDINALRALSLQVIAMSMLQNNLVASILKGE